VRMASHQHRQIRYERDEREGGYEREGWERGGPYQGNSYQGETSYSPQRPAIAGPPGTMKVMGGAGITENLDRPNMPVRQPVQERLVERSSRPSKRGGDRERESSREERRKKRKSRWTDEACKTFIPGLPTMIPGGLSREQEEAYLRRQVPNQSTVATARG